MNTGHAAVRVGFVFLEKLTVGAEAQNIAATDDLLSGDITERRRIERYFLLRTDQVLAEQQRSVRREGHAAERPRRKGAQRFLPGVRADFDDLPRDRRRAPQRAVRTEREPADLVRRLVDPQHALGVEIGIELQQTAGAGMVVIGHIHDRGRHDDVTGGKRHGRRFAVLAGRGHCRP